MIKKVLVFYNPISSAGQTALKAKELSAFLINKGIEVEIETTRKDPLQYFELENKIRSFDLIVAVGGDGTIAGLLEVLSATATPVLMYPAGNESLFARLFGMIPDCEFIYNTCKSGKIQERFFASVESGGVRTSFFTMASVGLDSLTVKLISINRSGPLSNFKYFINGLKALLNLQHPLMKVTVDGKEIMSDKAAYLIAANSPCYAKGINLVPDADPGSGKFTVGILEAPGLKHEIKKGIFMLLQRPVKLNFKYFTASQATVQFLDRNFPVQADGEYFRGRDVDAGDLIEIKIAGKIKVLASL